MTLLNNQWSIRYFECNPPFIQCPYITSLPSTLAILAEKKNFKTKNNSVLKDRLERILCCDWAHFSLIEPGKEAATGKCFYDMIQLENCRLPQEAKFDFEFYANLYASGTLRLRVYSSGKDQTLFDLFELNRFAPSELTLVLMLLYLRIIGRESGSPKTILKEEFYYSRLLEKIRNLFPNDPKHLHGKD